MDGVTLDAILSMVIKMAGIKKKDADYIVEKINAKNGRKHNSKLLVDIWWKCVVMIFKFK